ncbi:hypothetical protein WME73_25545 [Sorangium sp. So ce302]|uniref:hypothetical protein n=1 Tax=unclassified Sorangium TaxID=2621164 RepID=UPI003F5E32F9
MRSTTSGKSNAKSTTSSLIEIAPFTPQPQPAGRPSLGSFARVKMALMVWVVLLGALLFASACDSTVVVREDGHRASDGDGGGGGDGDGGTSAPGGGSSDTSSSSSSPGWTVPPDRVYSYIDCGDETADSTLFVEISPRGSGCLPAADVLDDVLVFGIVRWDGQPGTFTLGVETPHGMALAARGLQPDPLIGTLTIEPYVGTPSAIAWDLSVGAGRTDLSVCGRFDDFPCR